MSENPKRSPVSPVTITRISVTASFSDGHLITWTGDNPLNPELELKRPFDLLDIRGEDPYVLARAQPWRVSVRFDAGLMSESVVTSAIPPGEAVTVSRSDLARLTELAQRAADRDEAVIRACAVTGMPLPR